MNNIEQVEDPPAMSTEHLSDASSELSDPPEMDLDIDIDDTSSLSSLPGDDELEQRDMSMDKGTNNKRQAVDSDDDSDYAKPAKKRSKKTTSKKKQKSAGSKKKTNNKNVSKGKAQQKEKRKSKRSARIDSEDEEPEPVKKEKKQLVAKEVFWQDIPDWGDRSDCPLLDLPVEILDICFAPSAGLGFREYVALAGVSRLFRLRLNPTVFEAIHCELEGINHRLDLNTAPAFRILSAEVDDWRVYPNPPSRGTPKHYMPDGSRESWSQPQYIVYKEEQAKWRLVDCERIRLEAESAAATAARLRSRYTRTITVGYYHRKVLAVVGGRRDGEPAAARDERGLPLPSTSVKEEVTDPLLVSPSTSSANELVDGIFERDNHLPETGEELLPWSADRWVAHDWKIPDSDDEKNDLGPVVQWDKVTGEKAAVDHYPNQWRLTAAAGVNEKHITKTVTEAELLCLRHSLITNMLNSKIPQHMYIEAAVEALAFRSHGGPTGHAAYVKAVEERAKKAAEARAAKIGRAIADGTYVHKKKKPQIPPYLWRFRRELDYDFYWDT